MPDESKDTLTLESLLGAYSGPVSHASEEKAQGSAETSDLLSGLLGIGAPEPEPSPAPLDLEHLPTLPRIPLGGSAPTPREEEKLEQAENAQPAEASAAVSKRSEPRRERSEAMPAPVEKARSMIGRRKRLRAASEPHPAARPARESAPASQPPAAPASKPKPASQSEPKPASQPELKLAPKAQPKPKRKPKPEPAPAPRPEPPAPSPAPCPAVASASDRANETEKPERRGRHAVVAPAARQEPHPAKRPGRGKHADGPVGNPDADELRAIRRKLIAKMEALEEAGPAPAPHQGMQPDQPIEVATPLAQAEQPSSEAPRICIPAECLSLGGWLRDACAKHRKRTVRIAVACACAAVLCIASFAIGAALPSMDPLAPEAPDSSSQAQGEIQNAPRPGELASNENAKPSSDDEAQGNQDAPATAQTGPQEDRSGSVVYRYSMRVGQDESRSVTETVQFNAEGLCETSTMEATFADGDEAAAFLDTLSRSYASAYVDGSVDGSTAVSTIDVSANKLDREAYEDALRASVTDLSIVKKS